MKKINHVVVIRIVPFVVLAVYAQLTKYVLVSVQVPAALVMVITVVMPVQHAIKIMSVWQQLLLHAQMER
jgi:hypothetical protein